MGNFSSDSRFSLDQTVTVISQSIDRNLSVIRIRAIINAGGSRKYNLAQTSSFVTRIGGGWVGGGSFSYDFGRYQSLEIYDENHTVVHGDDGTCNVVVTTDATLSNPRTIGSANSTTNVKLPTIPRKTIPKVPRSFYIDNPLPVTLERKSSKFTHDVSLKVTGASSNLYNFKGATTTHTITLTEAIKKKILEQFTHEPHAQLEVVVVTKNGNEIVGTASQPVIGNFGNKYAPTIKKLVIEDWSSEQPESARIGVLAGITRMRAIAEGVVTQFGAVISDSWIVGTDYSHETGLFSSGGEKELTITMVDSRGKQTTQKAKIKVANLIPPKISRIDLVRCNKNGTNNPDGEYGKVVGDITNGYADIVTVTGAATTYWLDMRVRYRKTGTTRWANVYSDPGHPKSTIPINEDIQNVKLAEPMSSAETPAQLTSQQLLNIKQNESYEVEVTFNYKTITSLVSQQISGYTTVVPTIEIIFDIGDGGVGFGKAHERGGMDLKGQGYQNMGKRILDVDDAEVLEIGKNSNGSFIRYRDGRLVCRLVTSVASVNAAWGSTGLSYGYCANKNWTFPYPFINNEIVLNGGSTEYSGWAECDSKSPKVATGVHILRVATTYGSKVVIEASGYWK